jgi:CRISPR-associated endonuclease/helicase Cas3
VKVPAFYAHTLEGEPPTKWQGLEEHLRGVAIKAESFARDFGGSEEARMAGWLHDLGKFRDEFQRYLKKERGSGKDTHHAVYGAALAFEHAWPCAFAIAGHHAGLHNRCKLQELIEDPGYGAASQLPILTQHLRHAMGEIPADIALPPFVKEGAPWSLEFYVRMILSCLVDADYLDSEAYPPGQARPVIRLADIRPVLLERLLRECSSKPVGGTVNQVRREVFRQCREKAGMPPGFFSLTVPTGGGKTLSGMAFALAHAQRWGLQRVIVVIPYLSIIEQNAAEYRRVLDPENQGIVVEHHSAVLLPEGQERQERSPFELAAENWDAPVIVTTSVQFIESLFASSPVKCRKLHNIARSVVILDEVQTLPAHLLNPLLNVFRELKENYGASFLFMTATQPAFRQSPTSLSEGFKQDEVSEIVDDTPRIFASLRRVKYRREDTLDWQTLAKRLAALPQGLCVVNVRRHAFELWEELRGLLPPNEHDSLFHLSSAMCAEHRLWALGEVAHPRAGSIRHRLKRGLPCRVVSTQLVEAGVDVDFPVVFRALGPLDSIVQAAGRCNREMKLEDERGQPAMGQVIVFTPENHSLPAGIYKTATGQTAALLASTPVASLATHPEIFATYFSQLFQLTATDECKIQDDRQELRFREVSRKAKVIEDGVPVVVPYESEEDPSRSGRRLIEEIRARQPEAGRPRFDRHDLRRLQRFMVNLRPRDFQRLVLLHMVTPLLPNLELYCLEEGCYHGDLGLLIDKRPTEDLCGV